MIVKVKNGSYEEYEQLLLKRDQYRKEATQILISYTKEFGDLINAVFEKKIECIRLKKTISLCQMYINRGEPVDVDEMNSRISEEMAHYYKELEEMLAGTRAAKGSSVVPMAVVIETKRIYRKLAKLLHPDINPETDRNPELKDLWNRISIAYQNNALEELQELEVLALAAADNLGEGDLSIEIPDIEEKIGRLEREIASIFTTEPYTYRTLLADPAQIEKKRASLQAERKEYEDYSQSLQEMLDEMLMNSGGSMEWRMN